METIEVSRLESAAVRWSMHTCYVEVIQFMKFGGTDDGAYTGPFSRDVSVSQCTSSQLSDTGEN